MQFDSLWEAFNFITKCPLCGSKSQLEPMNLFKTERSFDTKIVRQTLIIQSFDEPSIMLEANLLTNKISNIKVDDNSKLDLLNVSIGQKCNKYHFYYSFTFKISPDNDVITNIMLERQHYIQIIDEINFSITTNHIDDTTIIRMTGDNYFTKELNLPAISFLNLNKKQFLNKLKVFELLG